MHEVQQIKPFNRERKARGTTNYIIENMIKFLQEQLNQIFS